MCARQYLHNVAPLKGRKRPACALITVCRRIIDVISRGFRPSILPERGTLSLAYRARAIATRASEPRECIDIDWIYLSAVTFRAMLSLRCLHALSLRTHRLVLLPPSRGNCCGCKLRRVIHHTCARPLHQRKCNVMCEISRSRVPKMLGQPTSLKLSRVFFFTPII